MNDYLDGAITYLEANPFVAGAIGLVLLYLLLRRTKQLLFLLFMSAVLGAVFFLIMELAGKGSVSKKEMIDLTTRQDVK